MRGAFIATLSLCLITLCAGSAQAHARHHHYHRQVQVAPVFAFNFFSPMSAEPTPAQHHWRHYAAKHHEHHKEVVSGPGNTSGMNGEFVAKLSSAFAAIPKGACHVGSGFRSHAEQARLYAQKPHLAAPPGHSNHERGLAADLECVGSALRWMHAHAAQYGLRFPMSYEDWHIEPIGATRYAGHSHRHYARRHYRHYAKG